MPNAFAERDCDNPLRLHVKLLCKMSGPSSSSKSDVKESKSDVKDVKVKKEKTALGKLKEIFTQDTLSGVIEKAKE